MTDVSERGVSGIDVVVVVWGEEFRSRFLDVCVPNQLTPGNLGSLPAGSRYRVFTAPDDVPVLESSPAAGRRVGAGGAVGLVVASGLHTIPDVAGQGRDAAAAIVQSAGFAPSFAYRAAPAGTPATPPRDRSAATKPSISTRMPVQTTARAPRRRCCTTAAIVPSLRR